MSSPGEPTEPQKYIGCLIRLKLVDLRILDGIVTVIDPYGNILLSSASEYAPSRIEPQKYNKRRFGLISVPRKSILRVSIHKSNYKNIAPPLKVGY